MRKLILFIFVLATGLWTGIANAQSPWLSDSRLSLVSLEWDKPLFDNDLIDRDEVSTLSSSLFFTGRVKLYENFRFVLELPVSHFGYQNGNPFGSNDYSTVIGNVYLGGMYDVETANPENHLYLELGFRMPTAREPNDNKRFGSVSGISSEASDRLEAFLWDTWSIPLIGSFITPISGPFSAKFRLGTLYDIYVDDLKSLENELHLLYGISGLYRESTLEASLGISGRNPYVGNNPDFGDDGFTQIRGAVARPFGNVVPGIYARKPLGKNYNDLVNFAFGLYIEVRG